MRPPPSPWAAAAAPSKFHAVPQRVAATLPSKFQVAAPPPILEAQRRRGAYDNAWVALRCPMAPIVAQGSRAASSCLWLRTRSQARRRGVLDTCDAATNADDGAARGADTTTDAAATLGVGAETARTRRRWRRITNCWWRASARTPWWREGRTRQQWLERCTRQQVNIPRKPPASCAVGHAGGRHPHAGM